MPIYEYLCPRCNRVYSFLAQRMTAPEAPPACPRCGATDLRKQVSRFAFSRGGAERPDRSGGAAASDGDAGPDPLDDPRVEREMLRLLADAEHMDEGDPRQMGRFMRRMSELTGEPLDEQTAEAVRRLEAGEDPERVEADLGDVFGGGDEDDEGGPFGFGRRPPIRDDGLYPM